MSIINKVTLESGALPWQLCPVCSNWLACSLILGAFAGVTFGGYVHTKQIRALESKVQQLQDLGMKLGCERLGGQP